MIQLINKLISVRTWTRGAILVSLTIAVSCISEKITIQKEEAEWWQPILQKHNLKLGAYNNFDNVFVMGMEGNSINNGICTLKMATVLIRDDKSYVIIEAEKIFHNIKENVFEIMSGVGNFYDMDCDLPEPTMTVTGLTRFRVEPREWLAGPGKGTIKTK